MSPLEKYVIQATNFDTGWKWVVSKDNTWTFDPRDEDDVCCFDSRREAEQALLLIALTNTNPVVRYFVLERNACFAAYR